MKCQINPNLGEIQLAALTTNDIQAMINLLAAKGLSFSTIKKAYDVINSCLKLGVIKGDLQKNPCIGVKLPKKTRKKGSEIRFLSQNEVDMISNECTAT